jgi:hypothetical protein
MVQADEGMQAVRPDRCEYCRAAGRGTDDGADVHRSAALDGKPERMLRAGSSSNVLVHNPSSSPSTKFLSCSKVIEPECAVPRRYGHERERQTRGATCEYANSTRSGEGRRTVETADEEDTNEETTAPPIIICCERASARDEGKHTFRLHRPIDRCGALVSAVRVDPMAFFQSTTRM